MFSNIKERVDSIILNLLLLLTNTMLFCVCWQVFSRYVLQMPAIFTEELVRFLLIWVALLGAAYSFGAHKHLSLSLLKDKASKKIQTILDIIIILIIMFIAIALLCYGGSKLIMVTWNQKSSVLQISMRYIYTILPLSGILIFFYKSYDLYQLIKGDK